MSSIDQTGGWPNAYGLEQVTMLDARAALGRVLRGGQADQVWAGLLSRAGLIGTEEDLDSVTRLVEAMMTVPHPVVALCARGLRIRLSSYQHLATTHAIIAGAH